MLMSKPCVNLDNFRIFGRRLCVHVCVEFFDIALESSPQILHVVEFVEECEVVLTDFEAGGQNVVTLIVNRLNLVLFVSLTLVLLVGRF